MAAYGTVPYGAGQELLRVEPAGRLGTLVFDVKNGSGNLLLDLLPPQERARLLELMESVPLAMRDVLAEPGRPMPTVYFPVDGIVSFLTTLGVGQAVEAASVGWEGMVGVEVFLGGEGTDNIKIVCQVDGKAWAMDASTFRRESATPGPFREVVERYARTMLVQTTQSAACNGSHTVEERLAKWISLITDWLQRDDFPLTHDFAAALLGVHRPSVTLAAGALQRAGIIDYRRGQVRVLAGDELREVACECYDVIRRAYDRLKEPVAGDGPGAVLRYAATVDRVSATLLRAGAERCRAGSAVRESARLVRLSRRSRAMARATRPGGAAKGPRSTERQASPS
jgi:CRP-like cAMP-binding protein